MCKHYYHNESHQGESRTENHWHSKRNATATLLTRCCLSDKLSILFELCYTRRFRSYLLHLSLNFTKVFCHMLRTFLSTTSTLYYHGLLHCFLYFIITCIVLNFLSYVVVWIFNICQCFDIFCFIVQKNLLNSSSSRRGIRKKWRCGWSDELYIQVKTLSWQLVYFIIVTRIHSAFICSKIQVYDVMVVYVMVVRWIKLFNSSTLSKPVIFNVGEITPRGRFYALRGRFCDLSDLGGDCRFQGRISAG